MRLCVVRVLAAAFAVSSPHFVTGAAATAQAPSGTVLFDPSHRETWDAAVEQIKRQEDQVIKALIDVAIDDKREKRTRQKAVLTLSALRNTRCREFLIANVGLRLGGGIRLSPEDMARETPCAYVLGQEGTWDTGASEGASLLRKRTDWTSAQAILFGIRKNRRTPDDLMGLAQALEVVVGPDLAIAALNDTLKQHTFPENVVWRENLTRIKTYLQQQ